MERGRDHRSRSMPRSYPYVGNDTAEDECVRIHGVSERKKQSDDIPKMGKHEIQVQESAILVQRVLCGHGREKYRSDKRVHSHPAKEG